MMRICLIYTGGTIGMVKRGGVLVPAEGVEDFVEMEPAIHEVAEIDFVPIMNKDSSNLSVADWQCMAEAVYGRRGQGYRGFVIAHGTDTMHFSASAVAFALGPKLWFPVVFTGSQTPAYVRHGDARTNLLRACMVAVGDVAEVCIAFGDYVFRGCRAQKKDERKFDAFESPAFPPLGYITDTVRMLPLAGRRTREGAVGKMDFRPDFAPGVIEITLIPGLEPELILPVLESPVCNGLILQSFGAGNVPIEGRYSCLGVIRRAVELNKPVIVTSQFAAGATNATTYETGVRVTEAGAISTGNMTNAAAVVKFRWVLAEVLGRMGRGELGAGEKLEAVRSGMNAVYVGEMD